MAKLYPHPEKSRAGTCTAEIETRTLWHLLRVCVCVNRWQRCTHNPTRVEQARVLPGCQRPRDNRVAPGASRRFRCSGSVPKVFYFIFYFSFCLGSLIFFCSFFLTLNPICICFWPLFSPQFILIVALSTRYLEQRRVQVRARSQLDA